MPPLVHVTMIAIDESSAVRFENGSSMPIEISDALNGKFSSASNYGKDLKDLETALRENDINFRVFSSMVAIRSSKWSTLNPDDLGS